MSFLFDPPISTSNLYEPNCDQVLCTLNRAFGRSGELIPGSVIDELEDQLCEYHECDYCVTMSTGFWALVASIVLRSLPGKDEVIIPSLTYRRLADVVFWARKVPVLVDVESDSLAICPNSVSDAINSRTSLILAVHPIVNCCQVSELITLANQKNIPIVFDAVESVHETYRQKRIGSFGIGEVFSFHASKLLNGIEGGYICTNEREFADRLREFRSDSYPKQHSSNLANSGDHPRLNGQMNDVHAAFATASLDEVDQNVQHNQRIYYEYCQQLDAIEGIELVRFDESEKTSFKSIVARVSREFPISRCELVCQLNELGILARSHYYPALHAKSYDFEVRKKPTPNSQVAMYEYINLPCGSRVRITDVVEICRQINRIADRATCLTSIN